MERTAPIAVGCVYWGTSQLTRALFFPGVPVCEPQVLIMLGPDYSSLKQKIKQQEADRS